MVGEDARSLACSDVKSGPGSLSRHRAAIAAVILMAVPVMHWSLSVTPRTSSPAAPVDRCAFRPDSERTSASAAPRHPSRARHRKATDDLCHDARRCGARNSSKSATARTGDAIRIASPSSLGGRGPPSILARRCRTISVRGERDALRNLAAPLRVIPRQPALKRGEAPLLGENFGRDRSLAVVAH